MRETGIVNREICDVLSTLGHTDEMIVCDAGFAIPNGIRTVDISLGENKPTVPEVLAELRKHFSVEKLIISEDTRKYVPPRFVELSASFGPEIPVETVSQHKLRNRARQVKAVIRTGDFTAYSNLLIVSGGGRRWEVEKPQRGTRSERG
jgi:D-ribose pyranase